MNKLIKTMMIVFMFTVIIFAQQNVGGIGLGYYYGLNEYSGVDGDSKFDWIPVHQIQYSHRIVKYLGIEVITGIGAASPLDEMTNGNPLDYITYVFPSHINFKIMPIIGKKYNPYIIIGYGSMNYDVKSFTGNIPTSKLISIYDGISKDGLHNNKQFNGGIGIEYFINNRFGLDVSARYGLYNGNSTDLTGYGDPNDQNIEFRFGMNTYFGKKADSDNDGILDSEDGAPRDAEDRDCFQDDDGIPDPDNDNDGILDVFDKAPNQPEDFDGFQDKDGAPDLDNDNDGILDIDDKEPNIAEDFDDFQDDDGAPDLDNDNDGILDIDDLCPNSPETINGYMDDDGCPDFEPIEIQTQENLLDIYFEMNQFIANDDFKKQMDSIAIDIINDEDAYLLIKGFADNTGSAEYNLILSKKRANWVRNYLISRGVDENKIGILSYGGEGDITSQSESRKSSIIKLK